MLQPRSALRLVKTVHTLVWAVCATSILLIPVLVWLDYRRSATLTIALVLGECLVLVVNGMRCPLTDVAARYTIDRRDNFDIYLPLWLARHNKLIFGALFTGDLVFTLTRWWL